jgi:hypothetical protein
MIRRGWAVGAGLINLLLTGCLFSGSSGADHGPFSVFGFQAPDQGVPELPDGKSNYQVRPVPKAPVGPVEAVKHEEPTGPIISAPVQVHPLVTATAVPAAPKATDAPLVAALRCALEKHPGEAGKLLEAGARPNRDLLLALLRLAAELDGRDLDRLPPEELAANLEQVAAIVRALRQKAPLALGNVHFCRRITGFGRYEALPVGHSFQAGAGKQPGERVQVYAEVRNFRSRLRDGQFETVLASSLEVRNEQGHREVMMNLGSCTDRSQTPRQDYFLNFQFHVPPRLPPGLYTLWVTVKDVTPRGGEPGPAREARTSLDFKVVAPGAAEP